MRKSLTSRQQQIYQFIADAVRYTGRPPTIREIGEEFNITSTNGVRSVLDALVKKGYIRRTPMVSRGIELTDYVETGVGSMEIQNIPVIGRVAAGEPILAVENVEGTLAVDRTFLPCEDVFALRVHGDSMKDAGILNGDYVLARQQHTAEKGDIVVAILGEEATVKRYVPGLNKVTLMPENEAYEPIVVGRRSPSFRIAGKVVGLMRRFQ